MMLWNCLFPAVFPAWRSLFLSLPGPGGAAREVSGCLGVLRGQGQWVAVPGQPKDGAGAAVVPPSAPSWQLLLNLPFIACQKRLGCFLPLLWPLILTFIILQAVHCPPLRVGHHRVGLRLCRGAQLFPPPQIFSVLPVVGEQWVNPQGCGRCAGEEVWASWRGVSCT